MRLADVLRELGDGFSARHLSTCTGRSRSTGTHVDLDLGSRSTGIESMGTTY